MYLLNKIQNKVIIWICETLKENKCDWTNTSDETERQEEKKRENR